MRIKAIIIVFNFMDELYLVDEFFVVFVYFGYIKLDTWLRLKNYTDGNFM